MALNGNRKLLRELLERKAQRSRDRHIRSVRYRKKCRRNKWPVWGGGRYL